jgi:hypothetical protein
MEHWEEFFFLITATTWNAGRNTEHPHRVKRFSNSRGKEVWHMTGDYGVLCEEW